mmetsp:Transcript_42329/g.95505  ORF Transcript_42329/g.95505 Transcript_42329/m.95505 type:complete len:224 (+) Transcript_42329:791-1462(+)
MRPQSGQGPRAHQLCRDRLVPVEGRSRHTAWGHAEGKQLHAEVRRPPRWVHPRVVVDNRYRADILGPLHKPHGGGRLHRESPPCFQLCGTHVLDLRPWHAVSHRLPQQRGRGPQAKSNVEALRQDLDGSRHGDRSHRPPLRDQRRRHGDARRKDLFQRPPRSSTHPTGEAGPRPQGFGGVAVDREPNLLGVLGPPGCHRQAPPSARPDQSLHRLRVLRPDVAH